LAEPKATILSDGWLSLNETMRTLGKSQRTIQKLVKAKHLKSKRLPRDGRGPEPVYWGADVERLAGESPKPQPAEPKLPAKVSIVAPKPAAQIVETAAIVKVLCEQFRAEREHEHATEFLTLPEASSLLRLPKAHLLRAIVDGRLAAVKAGGSWRIRRSTLEAFEG
jgi:excisionase family DNA binding protein